MMNYEDLNLKQLLERVNEEPENEVLFAALEDRIDCDPAAFEQLAADEHLPDEMLDWLAIENEYAEEDEMEAHLATRGLDALEPVIDLSSIRCSAGPEACDEPDAEMHAGRRWRNWVSTERIIPAHTCYPRNIRQVQHLIWRAEAQGKTIRAFGSGHAISDVAVTEDFVINTENLDRVLPLDKRILRTGADAEHLIQVEAGIKIAALNRQLEDRKLALSNMGGSAVQSLAGAISTSTHGSGIGLGPFPDMVRSVLMVSTGGKVYRIEPTNGITDPTRGREPNVELIQDDDHFNAVLVSMGCMGIIYAFIIAVEPKYLLRETRQLSKWSQVKTVLETLGVREQLAKYRHLEFLINPHRTHGDHTAIITKRVRQTGTHIPKGRPGNRNCLPSLISGMKITPKVFIRLFNMTRKKTPQYLDRSLRGISDEEFTNKSYEVLNQGIKQLKFVAGAIEVGFPVERTVEAVEHVLEACAHNVNLHGRYLTSPIAVRFVKGSNAFLSMMHGQDTCMIEIPSLINTREWKEQLTDMEQRLLAIGGRPHWGLNMKFKGDTPFRFESYYPRFHDWRRIYRKFNAKGTFDNKFTNRLSLSMRPPGEDPIFYDA